MKLREIYYRDIDRSINPAVVVSQKDQSVIEAEIKEYVFTDDIIEKLFEMLNTVLNKRTEKQVFGSMDTTVRVSLTSLNMCTIC